MLVASLLTTLVACSPSQREGAGTKVSSVPKPGVSSGTPESEDDTDAFHYSVKFTTNQHGLPESTCERPVCRELLQAIDHAQRSIDFAIYGVRAQPDIIDALIAAQARGVVIRGVVDGENADCSAFGYPDTPLLINALSEGTVVCDTGTGYSYIMHHKFFVFDGDKVWTGSTNISDTELGGEYNSDVALTIQSDEVAQLYEAEMDEMRSGLFHKRKVDDTEHLVDHFSDGTILRSYFSPSDGAIQHAVLPLIEEARHTLDIAMFFFTSQTIADALLAAHERGVDVRMILDAGGASNKYSKHTLLCASGVQVKSESWGGKSHSKWAVADAAYPDAAAVVLGSMNWTAAGDEQNDENTLYIKHASLAQAFAQEFARQWTDLEAVPVCTKVSIEGADASQCGAPNDCSTSCTSGSCCDGLDNDYDRRIDLAEEACACEDGLDNDRDGYVDADDYDCKNLPDP